MSNYYDNNNSTPPKSRDRDCCNWEPNCNKEDWWKICCCEHREHEKNYKSSAQFVSGINLMPPAVGQEIIGFWPLGNVQPVEIGVTAIADGKKIKLSGTNTVILQPGRYLTDVHALVANFDYLDPQGSDPIVTKLFLNGAALDYTINSVDVINQLFVLNSTQLNKSNIINVTQPNSTLQWMAGNMVSRDFHFDLYEASITITEI